MKNKLNGSAELRCQARKAIKPACNAATCNDIAILYGTELQSMCKTKQQSSISKK
jgi:hypothetical protein